MTNKSQLSSDGEILYSDRFVRGDLVVTGVFRRVGDKGIIIPMGLFVTIKEIELTDIKAADQFVV